MKASEHKENLRQRLLGRYSLRLHVSLLLLGTVAVGTASSKALLWLGVESMLWRYPLALLLAYLAFFGFVRLWLRQVGYLRAASEQERAQHLTDAADAAGTGGDVIDALRSSPRGVSSDGGGFGGHSGEFGGGGASASFAEVSVPPGPAPALASPSRSGGGNGSLFKSLDFDLDLDEAWPLVVAIVVLAIVVGGVFAYVLYAGPAVLVDAAFEATLAGGLLRAGRNTARGDWVGSVWRATWIPFALVQAAALGFVWAAAIYTPGAVTFGEVIRQLLAHG
ncbi:hypothetical protein BURK2_00214 [Burkholderiales bacterium]|nr:hypothetical protein BURK2_00214 [Burkholderiales bacterium]